MGQESVWFEVGVKEGHLSIAVAVFSTNSSCSGLLFVVSEN
jgi:hypothetical protein